MTRFLQDIMRQPEELLRVIHYLNGAGHRLMASAAGAIRGARHTCLRYRDWCQLECGVVCRVDLLYRRHAGVHAGCGGVAALRQHSPRRGDPGSFAKRAQHGNCKASGQGTCGQDADGLSGSRTLKMAAAGARNADIRGCLLPVKADQRYISEYLYSVLAAVAAAVASATVDSFDAKPGCRV